MLQALDSIALTLSLLEHSPTSENCYAARPVGSFFSASSFSIISRVLRSSHCRPRGPVSPAKNTLSRETDPKIAAPSISPNQDGSHNAPSRRGVGSSRVTLL